MGKSVSVSISGYHSNRGQDRRELCYKLVSKETCFIDDFVDDVTVTTIRSTVRVLLGLLTIHNS